MTRVSSATELGAIYDEALLYARGAARAKGYALAVHGSEIRDFDLVAIPWTDDACSQLQLAEAVIAAVHGSPTTGDPVKKPHGRLAWAIHLSHSMKLHNKLIAKGFTPYIDLSVMPTRKQLKEVSG